MSSENTNGADAPHLPKDLHRELDDLERDYQEVLSTLRSSRAHSKDETSDVETGDTAVSSIAPPPPAMTNVGPIGNSVGPVDISPPPDEPEAPTPVVHTAPEPQSQTPEVVRPVTASATMDEAFDAFTSTAGDVDHGVAELIAQMRSNDELARKQRDRIAKLEQELAAASQANARLGSFESETHRLEREIERLNMVVEARSVERDELALKIRAIESERHALKRELDDQITTAAAHGDDRAELTKQIQRLEAEITRTRRDHEGREIQLATMTEERDALNRRLSEMREEQVGQVARINELEVTVERRDSEIKHLKKLASRDATEMDRLKAVTVEYESAVAERDQLRRRVDSLETELTGQTTEAGASKKALELLAARTSERDEMERSLVKLKQQLAAEQTKSLRADDLERELKRRTTERDELEAKVLYLEAQVASERAQIEEWRKSADIVAETMAERDQLKQQLDSARTELQTRPRPEAASPLSPVPVDAISGDSALSERIAALEKLLAANAASADEHMVDPAVAFEEAMAAAVEASARLESAASYLDTIEARSSGGLKKAPMLEPSWGTSSNDHRETAARSRQQIDEMYHEALRQLGTTPYPGPAPSQQAPPPAQPPRFAPGPAPLPSISPENQRIASELFTRSRGVSATPPVDVITGGGSGSQTSERDARQRAEEEFFGPPSIGSSAIYGSGVSAAPSKPAATPAPSPPPDAPFSKGSTVIIDGDSILATTGYPERFLDAFAPFATARQLDVDLVFDTNRIAPNPSLGSRDSIRVRFAQKVDVGEVVRRLIDAAPADGHTVVVSDNPSYTSGASRPNVTVVPVDTLVKEIA